MNRNRTFVFGVAMALIAVLAFGLRAKDIGNRPMHGDEAVHAAKFRELWQNGVYKYDSNEYHGPTIYYAALPSVILHGRTNWIDTREADYRLPIAVFGAAMILLLIPISTVMGRASAFTAAILIAISPAFVFYSRYFIQEVPFVFFSLGMIVYGWRYYDKRSKLDLILAAVCAGLMIASKETCILTFAAIIPSLLLSSWYGKKQAKSVTEAASPAANVDTSTSRKPGISPAHIALAVVLTLFTSILFLSGMGKNLHAPLDYLTAYLPWFHRASGVTIQNHPFTYYLQVLFWSRKVVGRSSGAVWSEGLIVGLALIGIIISLQPKRLKERFERGFTGNVVFWRFLSFYTLILTLIYSVIPYKTPWCVLSFLLGMCLLSGRTVSEMLVRAVTQKRYIGGLAIVLIAAIVLARLSYFTSFVAYADPHNPYVYAATATDVVNVVKRIDDLAKYAPIGNQLVIKVFAQDNYYWPLPWYLRRYPNVGFYNHTPRSKEEALADVTMCDAVLDDEMTALLGDADLMNGINEVRNEVFYDTFIKMDVWTSYLTKKNGGVMKKFIPPPPAD